MTDRISAAMAAQRMHPAEVDTDIGLVGRLLAAQFPLWADLPLRPVPSSGTDNMLYRLGDDMVVRLPRIHWATKQVDKEYQWLPRLARDLPRAVPVPVGKGEPAEGYPWHWSIYLWLEGENPTVDNLADPDLLALDLAEFVTAMGRIDSIDGPPAGVHNFFRGAPLAARDTMTRRAIEDLRRVIDPDAATAYWEAALQAPEWSGPPVWVHGDLAPGNLLLVDGRLSAVIDFGGLGVGDPAVDTMVAWNLLPPGLRSVFRDALGVDDATWARGRGWALSVALVALPYYRGRNPTLAASSLRVIDEVLGVPQR